MDKPELMCRVCGDKASGKHYGVTSCDGCRGFFKRSIRRNLDYVCKEQNNCIVDVTRRNQCQACRFRKCLQVNMKRDAVQHERAPRSSSAKPRLHPSFFTPPLFLYPPFMGPPTSSTSSASSSSHHHHGVNLGHKRFAFAMHPPMGIPHLLPPPMIPTSLHLGLSGTSMISNLNNPQNNQGLSQESHSESESRESKKVEDDHEEVSSTGEIHGSSGKVGGDGEEIKPKINYLGSIGGGSWGGESVYETAARLLFMSIKWARCVPSFLALQVRDQALLLEESWPELFILSASQWGLTFDPVILACGSLTLRQKQEVTLKKARLLRETLDRAAAIHPDHTELACLKALVLFKPAPVLIDQLQVEILQDHTQLMLQEYCLSNCPLSKNRFGKLLLLLPSLRRVDGKALEDLFFKQTIGNVSIEALLDEIIRGGNLF